MATLTEHEAARKEKLGARIHFLMAHDYWPYTDATWRNANGNSIHTSAIESWGDYDWEMFENMVEIE